MPCVICLKSKRFYQDIRELKCGHRFHLKCIYNWSHLKKSCPLCRIPILKQNQFNIGSYIQAFKRNDTDLMNEIQLQSGIEY
jgi:hypothetical protein